MSTSSNRVLIPLFVVLVSFLIYKYTIRVWTPNVQESKVNPGLITTHGECHGSNNTNRRCHFKNICLRQKTKDFIFFLGHDSLRAGIPDNRFDWSLVDTTSVEDHTHHYFNFVDVLNSRLKPKAEDVKWINGRTFLFTRFIPNDMTHLFHEDIFPLVATIDRLSIDGPVDSLLYVDPWDHLMEDDERFAHEMYQKLFPKVQQFHYEDFLDKYTCFEHLLVGLDKDTLWYDHGFQEFEHPRIMDENQKVRFRKILRNVTSRLSSPKYQKCSSRPVTIIRTQKTRLIVNELELILALNEKQFTVETLNVKSFSSFSEILSKIRCTKILIGMHGVDMILGAFLPPDGHLVELFPFAVPPENYTPYKTLMDILGIKYTSWKNKNEEDTITYPDRPEDLGGIRHLSEEVQTRIENSYRVPRHKCCRDPEFLFRINQDTRINVQQVMAAIFDTSSPQPVTGSLNYILSPARIRNATCTRLEDGWARITWSAPWNEKFIVDSNQSLVYEILVQPSDTERVKKYNSSKTSLEVKVEVFKTWIWIRAQNGKLMDKDPLIC